MSKDEVEPIAAEYDRRGCELNNRSACIKWSTSGGDVVATVEKICALGGARGVVCGTNQGTYRPFDAWFPPGVEDPRAFERRADAMQEALRKCYRSMGAEFRPDGVDSMAAQLKSIEAFATQKGRRFYVGPGVAKVLFHIPLLYGSDCAPLVKLKQKGAKLFATLLEQAKRNVDDPEDADLISRPQRQRMVSLLESIEQTPSRWQSVRQTIISEFPKTPAMLARDEQPNTPIPPAEFMAKSWRFVRGKLSPQKGDEGPVLDFWPDGRVTGGDEFFRRWKVKAPKREAFIIGAGDDHLRSWARWPYRFGQEQRVDGRTVLQGTAEAMAYLEEVTFPHPTYEALVARLSGKGEPGEYPRLAKRLTRAAREELSKGRWGTAGAYLQIAGHLRCAPSLPEAEANKAEAIARGPSIVVSGNLHGAAVPTGGTSARRATIQLSEPRFEKLVARLEPTEEKRYKLVTKTYDFCNPKTPCFQDWQREVANQKALVSQMRSHRQSTSGERATSTSLARAGTTADLSGKTQSNWRRGRGGGTYTSSGYSEEDVKQAEKQLADLVAKDPRKNPELETKSYNLPYIVRGSRQVWGGELVRDAVYREPNAPGGARELRVTVRIPIREEFLSVQADPENAVAGFTRHMTRQELSRFQQTSESGLQRSRAAAEAALSELMALTLARDYTLELAEEGRQWSAAERAAEAKLRAAYVSDNGQVLAEPLKRLIGPSRSCDEVMKPGGWKD